MAPSSTPTVRGRPAASTRARPSRRPAASTSTSPNRGPTGPARALGAVPSAERDLRVAPAPAANIRRDAQRWTAGDSRRPHHRPDHLRPEAPAGAWSVDGTWHPRIQELALRGQGHGLPRGRPTRAAGEPAGAGEPAAAGAGEPAAAAGAAPGGGGGCER